MAITIIKSVIRGATVDNRYNNNRTFTSRHFASNMRNNTSKIFVRNMSLELGYETNCREVKSRDIKPLSTMNIWPMPTNASAIFVNNDEDPKT
jgi:hypothetical protein